jgi:uncharacterized protein
MPLRCLCLSDLHLDAAAARRLGGAALTGNFDVVLSAGDLGLDGKNDPAVYEAISRGLVPVLSVPGNHDGDAAYDVLVARHGWTDLHGRVVERDGWWFAGFGLRVWSNALSDSATAAPDPELAAYLAGLEKIPAGRLVLIVHVPPAGTLASRDHRFVDRGSGQLLRWIEARQPAAVACGHVHHREVVVDRIGATLVVNAGPHGWVLTL